MAVRDQNTQKHITPPLVKGSPIVAARRVFLRLLSSTLFIILAFFQTHSVLADDLPLGNPFLRYANPDHAVLAIQTKFDIENGYVRVSIYRSNEEFLNTPALRFEGELDETGFALFSLEDLEPHQYSFIVYLDENTDGQLNRNFIGRPKEPYIFSNDIVPALRKPTFEETKVDVGPGQVVVLTLE